MDKQLAGSNISRDEAIRSRDSMEKKLEEMLTDITEAKAGKRGKSQQSQLFIFAFGFLLSLNLNIFNYSQVMQYSKLKFLKPLECKEKQIKRFIKD